MRSYLSVAMPETCPRIQLIGNGFGQNGSIWNCGSGAAFWPSAPWATSATITPKPATMIFLMVSSRTRHANRACADLVKRSAFSLAVIGSSVAYAGAGLHFLDGHH